MNKTELLSLETILTKNFEIAQVILGKMEFESQVHWDTMSHKNMTEGNRRSNPMSHVDIHMSHFDLHIHTYTRWKGIQRRERDKK